MALNKREYITGKTIITAENLNEIQDSVIGLENNATNVENSVNTLENEIIEIKDNIGTIPFAEERPADLSANSLWFDTSEEDPGKAIQITVEKYDIGDIFITTREGDPTELLGYGTWQQIKDSFLLAAGDSYTAGATGGEATHTLTTAEMPAHSHEMSNSFIVYDSSSSKKLDTAGNSTKVDTNNNVNATTKSTGGGQAHNNMPPYLVVYMWLRTA